MNDSHPQPNPRRKSIFQLLISGLLVSAASRLQAQDSAAGVADAISGQAPLPIDSGDTAWMIVATVLVLFMTLPGLALFYGGLVRTKNVLSILVQCFAMAAVMTVLWVVYGYSVAFNTTGMEAGVINFHSFFGGLGTAFLSGIGVDSVSGTIPESVFVTFQMTFAIITPALIVGAFAERMKFSAIMLFCVAWFTFSYLPICHMAWAGDGALFAEWGVIDFAGGTVVHINAGIAGLAACLMVGKRRGFGLEPLAPHNVPLTLIGASMLWVGWFGFNAGSELAADGTAGMALLVTQVAAAAAALTWMAIEWIKSGTPTAVGIATGAVAGLVAITPGSGSVGPMGALAIGFASSACCYLAVSQLKRRLRYDDSLDVFGVHGIGGIVGALLAGCFFIGEGGTETFSLGVQTWIQLKSILVTIVWSGLVSLVALTLIQKTIGLRVDVEDEELGLDLTSHGEAGYTH